MENRGKALPRDQPAQAQEPKKYSKNRVIKSTVGKNEKTILAGSEKD